jgi:nucleoid-associated protein YgaU
MNRHPAGKALVPQAADADSQDEESAEISRAARSAPPFPPPHTPAPSVATDCRSPYTVRSGDSLWAIAASLEDSASSAQVARATHKIFDLNRATVGPDPDVIYPGQSLKLPDDCSR